MIPWLLGALGCGAGAPPDALVQALSGYHEVPTAEELSVRFPGLADHLRQLSNDADRAPHVRSRARVLLASLPDGASEAARWVTDAGIPGATRYKVLRQLADHHPDVAVATLDAVWCDEASVVRSGARRVAARLADAGHDVPAARDCSR